MSSVTRKVHYALRIGDDATTQATDILEVPQDATVIDLRKIVFGTSKVSFDLSNVSLLKVYGPFSGEDIHKTDLELGDPLLLDAMLFSPCEGDTMPRFVIVAPVLGQVQEGPRIPQNNDDDEEPENLLGAGVLEKLYAAVFYFKDAKGDPIGTGYFINATTAVSAAHNFPDKEKGTRVTGYLGREHKDQVYRFALDFIDRESDFAVLILDAGKAKAYLDPAHISLSPGVLCVLVAFQIGIQNELEGLVGKLSVGVFPASIVKAHDRHFVYLATSFDGDSGGAIILRNGKAIGIHTETVNQARDRLRVDTLREDAQTRDIVSHLKDVEGSVDSLIASLNSGAVGISVSFVAASYFAATDKQSTKVAAN